MKVWFWNLRANLAWKIMPGKHKHMSCQDSKRECNRCDVLTHV